MVGLPFYCLAVLAVVGVRAVETETTSAHTFREVLLKGLVYSLVAYRVDLEKCLHNGRGWFTL